MSRHRLEPFLLENILHKRGKTRSVPRNVVPNPSPEHQPAQGGSKGMNPQGLGRFRRGAEGKDDTPGYSRGLSPLPSAEQGFVVK